MKKLFMIFAVSVSALYFSHNILAQKQYDGWYIMQQDELPAIRNLRVKDARDVLIFQDSRNHFKILAKEDTDYVTRYRIEDGSLTWYSDRKRNAFTGDNTQKEVVFLYLKPAQLEKISVRGASDVSMLDNVAKPDFKLYASGASDVDMKFSGDKLFLKCSGASDVTADLHTKLLISEISGASDVVLKGKTVSHKVEIHGASDLEAAALETEVTEIVAAGSSDADINAGKLIKQVSGSSEVNCHNAGVKIQNMKGKHYSLFSDFPFMEDIDIDVIENEDGSLHINIGGFSIDVNSDDVD